MNAPDAAPVVTDQERADAFVGTWLDNVGAPDARLVLAEEFGAVRLDERRAIVAWLREHGAGANAIERGEHGS